MEVELAFYRLAPILWKMWKKLTHANSIRYCYPVPVLSVKAEGSPCQPQLLCRQIDKDTSRQFVQKRCVPPDIFFRCANSRAAGCLTIGPFITVIDMDQAISFDVWVGLPMDQRMTVPRMLRHLRALPARRLADCVLELERVPWVCLHCQRRRENNHVRFSNFCEKSDGGIWSVHSWLTKRTQQVVPSSQEKALHHGGEDPNMWSFPGVEII